MRLDRRHFIKNGVLLAAAGGLNFKADSTAAASDQTGLQGSGKDDASEIAASPEFHIENTKLNVLHLPVFRNALRNLLVTNTVVGNPRRYNRSGLFLDPPGRFFRAGADYGTPWTRDASINSWSAASLLAPAIARNTLWAVCERQANGRLIIQRDEQWWDKVIWAQGAWTHFLVTGDREFLASAYEAVSETLTEHRRERFNEWYGLFEGPSVLCDGIAGYPEPPYDPKVLSSFILDFPGGDKLLCLSTNCVVYQAHRCAAWMARQLDRPPAEAADFTRAAEQLRLAIRRHFWIPAKSTFGYFIHGAGRLAGKLDESQEGMGLAYAILFDVADASQVRAMLRSVHLQPKGITCVWPHFARFDDAHPGRHNVLVWPMASGMWAHAAAKAGAVGCFTHELASTAEMVHASGDIFYEIYNSVTGTPDGGWQSDRKSRSSHQRSCIHQTWSATGYLRMILYGLFGLNFEPGGVRLAPTLPPGWGGAELHGLRYRRAMLNIRIEGEGQQIAAVAVDGEKIPSAFLAATLTGAHQVHIRLHPA